MKKGKKIALKSLTEEDKRKRTRELAYSLWLEEGMPQGRDLDHWLEAEYKLFADGKGTGRAARERS